MITPRVRALLASAVRAACISVVIIGVTTAVDWVFNITPLPGVIADYPALKMNAAIGVTVAAWGLWLLKDEKHTSVAGTLCAAAVLALGLMTMAEGIWDRDFGIDELFVPDTETATNPGRIELATSIMLTLTAAGLLMVSRRRVVAAQWLAVALACMTALALQAWIYGALNLFEIPAFSAVGMQTIVAFALLSIGILAVRGDQGIIAVFVSSRPGGLMVRRLWVPLIALVVVMGTLLQWLQVWAPLAAGIDSAILVVWVSVLSSVLIWLNARAINRLDSELRLTMDERMSAEQTLRRQASLFDQAYEGMVMSRWKGPMTFWNRGAEQVYGFKRDEAVGRVSHDLLRTTAPEGVPLILQALERNRYWEGELHRQHMDGRQLIVDTRMTLVEDEGGAFIVEASRDITERVRTQVALRESERRFREIAEWLPQLVWTCEPDGWCDYLSQRWLDYTGSTLEEEVGYGWVRHVHPEDKDRLLETWNVSVNDGCDFRIEFRIQHHDGTFRWFDTRALPLRDESGAIVKWFGSNTDIDTERAIRETLRSNEERLALALEINQTAAWDLDLVRNQVRRTLEHDRIFGYETLQSMWTFDTFVNHIVPEERDRIRRLFNKTFTLPVDDWAFDCRIRRVDDAVRWIAVRGRSKRNASGVIEVLSGVVQDVTDRKQIEEEILRLNTDLEGRVEQRTQELEVANRELEAFSYSVSHDLRAPLRTIDGFSQAVLEDFAPELPAEGQRYLKIIRDGAQRMGRLIDDLLVFSRLSRQLLNTRRVDMHRLACDAWQELAEHNRHADVQIDQLPGSFGDSALLKQVWLNLLSNALKYSRDRMPPRVHVGHVLEGEQDVYFVRDNGTGFDMQYAHKLFGVFQRLHRSEDFEGTGVGLAVVQRIVHRHGGRVWAEAEIDQGATFRFTLDAKDIRDPQPTR
jgi:PAS domain S-box-containing protein